jgi:hypothetical protein
MIVPLLRRTQSALESVSHHCPIDLARYLKIAQLLELTETPFLMNHFVPPQDRL